MNEKKLIKLIETIISLKEKLKCPICLDVMQDVAELCCGHKYCKECYLEHKSTQKQPSCPLCKNIFKRRSVIYTDNYASTLGQFVYNCCENIKNVYKCEVEQLQKRLKEEVKVLQNKDNVLEQNVTPLAVPSTSKDTNQKRKQIGLVRSNAKKASKRKMEVVESLKENDTTVFDKLLNNQPAITFNRKGTKHVYVNKKKLAEQAKTEYDILKFDNDENKTNVLRWLQDTRNKFGRLSQTQNTPSENMNEVAFIDLVSVSQIKGKKEVCNTVISKFHRNRAKSLDIEVKKLKPTQKNLNTQARSVSLENYNIDENTEEEMVKKVEEKVILDLIEDEFLDTLNNAMNDSEFEIKTKRRTKTRKKSKPLSPVSTTTGWDRLNKIERTIKKNERAPKQLNITLQSTQELKKPNDDSKQKVIVNKLPIPVEESGTCKTADVDFARKLLRVDLTQTDLTVQGVESNKSGVSCEKVDVGNKSRPPETDDHHETTTNQQANENDKQSYDLESIEEYITKNIKIMDKTTSTDNETSRVIQVEKEEDSAAAVTHVGRENIDFEDPDCVLLEVMFSRPTQKISLDNSKPKQESEVIVIDDDVTDVKCTEPKVEITKRDDSLDEVTKLYTCPTQRMPHTYTDAADQCDSMEGLFSLFEECLDKCVTSFKSADAVVENQLRNLQFILSKLQSLHKTDKNVVKTAVCDAETQTGVDVTNNTAQTECNVQNIEVQTEELRCVKCNADLRESEGPENVTVISQDTKAAMELMLDETNVDFKPTLHSTAAKKQSKPRLRYDDFTCTLDNLNFDTQEIAKNQGSITKITQKINKPQTSRVETQEIAKNQGSITNITQKINEPQTSRAEADKKNQENIPGSVLICSLNSNKSMESNKLNRKLSFDGNKITKFKRIKRPAGDSDSEEEENTPAKRKCNRFLRDDLTIEFFTNSETTDVNHKNKTSRMESQDSEGFNYDEYLAEVMKKYEDNNFSITPPQGFKKPKGLTPKTDEKTCKADKNKAGKVLSDTSSVDSFRTASDSVSNNFDDGLSADDVFMNEDNLLKLDNDIREYERNAKAQDSEISDIIAETEDIEPLSKKRKTIVTKNGAQSKNVETKDKNSDLKLSNNVLNNKELENVAGPSKAQPGKKINVLANVKIRSQNRLEEDNLFSDEDIVETTPEKKVNSFADRLPYSQLPNSRSLIVDLLISPKETETFDFDIVPLPPPPDFQDDVDIPSTPEKTNDDETTVIDLNKSSLTPDNLSQFMFTNTRNRKPSQCIKQNTKETLSTIKGDFENTSMQRNIVHSTPIVENDFPRETMGFSPISARNSQKFGIAEMAQAAKYTPLNVVTKATPPQKQNLLTSTPQQKSIWNYVKPSQSDDAKPCIACTRLSKDQIKTIVKLTNKKLATYNSHFDANVTHMIVSVTDTNCVKDYTIKFVSAVAAGIWVLRFEWVEECLQKQRIVPEEPFEVLDISGCPGPRTSRLTRTENPLLRGYKFFCAEPFLSTTKEEVENIVKLLEGRILHDLRELLEDDGNIGIILGEGHATQDFEQYEKWMETYKTVTVDIEWLSKCVGQYKILNFRPFIWCSEDNIGDLGYPSVLTETVPFSLTETL